MDPFFIECRKDFLVYISSSDSLSHYPQNNFYQFTTILPRTLRLIQNPPHHYSSVSVNDAVLLGPNDTLLEIPENIVIITNIIEPTIVHGGFKGILKHLWKTDSNSQPSLSNLQQHPLTTNTINTISFKLETIKFETLNLQEWEKLVPEGMWNQLEVNLVLHFQLLETPL